VPIPLRTARLVLRYLTPADAEVFFTYRSSPAVSAMQGWMPASRAEADVFVGSVAGVPFGRRGTWSQLGIVEAGNDALIGDAGVYVDARGAAAEIGYTIAPAFQRRGYATEAVRAILAELEAIYAIRCFVARTDPRNVASIALLVRLGFREEAGIGEDRHFRMIV
jgi:RimJ/RimL family protein N-acetyltransferase